MNRYILTLISSLGLATGCHAQFINHGPVMRTSWSSYVETPIASDDIRQETYEKLSQHVYDSIEFLDADCSDVFDFIAKTTNSTLDIYYYGTNIGEDLNGFFPESHITIRQIGPMTALELLEKTLSILSNDSITYTWQIDSHQIMIGSETKLCDNSLLITKFYDISDLMFIPTHNNTIPNLDLEQAMRNDVVINSISQNARTRRLNHHEKAQVRTTLSKIIRENVSPNVWEGKGGPCSIIHLQESFVIRAPEFVHRQLEDYSWVALNL